MILENLSQIDGEDIMRTIAQKYIEEGEARGIEKGKAVGIQEGKAVGVQEGMEKAALNMLSQNLPPYLIAQYTGLTIEQINKLKSSADNSEDTHH